MTIEARLAEVRARIVAAAERAGRDPSEVTLVAVSKGHSVEALRRLYDAGQRDFGENRAQELEAKAREMPPDARWHYLGQVQRNKIPILRARAALVHGFDRPDLAGAWGAGAPPVLLQVNVGREPQKQGVMPEDAEAALATLRAGSVRVAGLMAIPPLVEDAEAARVPFRALCELRDRLRASDLGVAALSMGMSLDYEVAIEEGATHVRVGTGIFGERPHPPR